MKRVLRQGSLLVLGFMVFLLIPAMLWAQAKPEPLTAELSAPKTSGTLYEKFRFIVEAKGGTAPYEYLWLGRYKRKAAVDIDFKTPGSKNIWVVVKDAAGNSFRVEKQIEVLPRQCRVNIRSAPGPNHTNQRDVVVMMGEMVDLRAMVRGCRVAKYHWSADPAPTALGWPQDGWSGIEQSRVAFITRNLGPTKITLTVTTDEGKEHQADITVHVNGAQYEVKCSPQPDATLKCEAKPLNKLGLNGPFVIRWQPHPEVTFKEQEQFGEAVQTQVSSNEPDTYRIWVDVLLKDGSIFRNVGESEAIEAQVPLSKK